MDHARVTLVAGHYGSGKTNIAVNLRPGPAAGEVQRVTVARPGYRQPLLSHEGQRAGMLQAAWDRD